jgi:hypothetical protein
VGLFAPVCRVIQQLVKTIRILRTGEEQVNSKIFKLLFIFAAWNLLWLGAPAVSAAQGQVYTKLEWTYQEVRLHKGDGTIFRGEFASEIVLLSNGGAIGGFGIWELASPNVLSLYQVVEGRVVNRLGPAYEFKAKRLGASLPSEDEITVSMRGAPAQPPNGSVRFLIDGVNSADGQPLSFEARGTVNAHAPLPTLTDLILDDFNYVEAPPQTVVVQTLRGSYTARFENLALVFPDGDAIGVLAIAGPGEPNEFRITRGRTPRGGAVAAIIWAAHHNNDNGPLPVLMVLADRQDFSRPVLDYRILGSGIGLAHIEAQGRITGLAADPR